MTPAVVGGGGGGGGEGEGLIYHRQASSPSGPSPYYIVSYQRAFPRSSVSVLHRGARGVAQS